MLYTADIGVGSPATYYTVLVDTRSSNTWIGANKAYAKTATSQDTGNAFRTSRSKDHESAIKFFGGDYSKYAPENQEGSAGQDSTSSWHVEDLDDADYIDEENSYSDVDDEGWIVSLPEHRMTDLSAVSDSEGEKQGHDHVVEGCWCKHVFSSPQSNGDEERLLNKESGSAGGVGSPNLTRFKRRRFQQFGTIQAGWGDVETEFVLVWWRRTLVLRTATRNLGKQVSITPIHNALHIYKSYHSYSWVHKTNCTVVLLVHKDYENSAHQRQTRRDLL
ncbi:hypothetical protein EV424DRAFT_1349962 [Suillus variegatus]|nr:hypothetical protein EV424DRAFT_1349962 [Suillus variegatus]